MNFKKIKFNSKDKTLELSYNEYNGIISNEVVIKCGQIVHSDFIDTINALKYHFAFLCDLREVGVIDEREQCVDKLHEHTALKEVSVQSVVFSSIGEDDAVMLCGNKRFDGRYINVNSPITPLNGDGYIHYWELQAVLEALQEEARMYLCERKWGVVQTEMDFGMAAEFEEDVEQALYENTIDGELAAINVTEKPKRGRKSKAQSIDQSLVS